MPMSKRRNFILMWAGEACWGTAMGLVMTSTVLAVYLKEYGAGPVMIGSISSIESGSVMLGVAGLFLFRSRRRRKRQVLGWHFCAIIPFLFLNGLLASMASHLPA